MTGAPKHAACGLLAGLEPVGRGPAMGAFGLVWPGGLDLGSTIRTIAVADGRVHLWAGGGITWGSDPVLEGGGGARQSGPRAARAGSGAALDLPSLSSASVRSAQVARAAPSSRQPHSCRRRRGRHRRPPRRCGRGPACQGSLAMSRAGRLVASPRITSPPSGRLCRTNHATVSTRQRLRTACDVGDLAVPCRLGGQRQPYRERRAVDSRLRRRHPSPWGAVPGGAPGAVHRRAPRRRRTPRAGASPAPQPRADPKPWAHCCARNVIGRTTQGMSGAVKGLASRVRARLSPAECEVPGV